MARHQPARVIALGDSFHDGGASERLGTEERAQLEAMTSAAQFVWIAGNPRSRSAGMAGWRGSLSAFGWAGSPFAMPRLRRLSRAKWRGICTLAPVSPNGAAACAGAVLSRTAFGSSCRPLAPIPAGWMSAMTPLPRCSRGRSTPICWVMPGSMRLPGVSPSNLSRALQQHR